MPPICESIQTLIEYATFDEKRSTKGKLFLKLDDAADGQKVLRKVFETERSYSCSERFASLFGTGPYSLKAIVAYLVESNIQEETDLGQKKMLNLAFKKLNLKIKRHNLKISSIFQFSQIGKLKICASEELPNTAKVPSPLEVEILSREHQHTLLGDIPEKLNQFCLQVSKTSGLFQEQIDNALSTLRCIQDELKARFGDFFIEKLLGKTKERYLFVFNLLIFLEKSLYEKFHDYSRQYVFDKERNVIKQKGDGDSLYKNFSYGIELQGGSHNHAQKIQLEAPRLDKYSAQELKALVHNFFVEQHKADGVLYALLLTQMLEQNQAFDESYKEAVDVQFTWLLAKLLPLMQKQSSYYLYIINLERKIKELQARSKFLSKQGLDLQLNVLEMETKLILLTGASSILSEQIAKHKEMAKNAKTVQFLNALREFQRAKKERLTLSAEEFRKAIEKQEIAFAQFSEANKEMGLEAHEKTKELHDLVLQVRLTKEKISDFYAERMQCSIDLTSHEAALQEYFRRTLEEGSWAGAPEIYALCQIFRLNVKISRENSYGLRVEERFSQEFLPKVADALGIVHLDFENGQNFHIFLDIQREEDALDDTVFEDDRIEDYIDD